MVRIREEQQVMHGRDEWRPRRRNDVARVVHDVDGARGPLDERVTEPLPSFVERPARNRELSYGDGRAEGVRGWPAMLSRDTDEIQVVALGEGAEQLHRRDRDPSRNEVP
jgi:hypothetical protein